MRFLLPLLLIPALAACKPITSTHADDSKNGRYQGIGIYNSSAGWSRLAPPGQDAKASVADDEQVIVVTDTRTGEVRQCGALSGYCIAMNPWASDAMRQTLPATLNPKPATK